MLLGAVNLGMRGISVVSTIFLVRVLEPSDFGIVALALILLQTSSLFSGLGMRQALVQTKLPVRIAAPHAIIITSVTGICCSLIVYVNAYGFATLLGNAQVADLLRWLAPIILIQSVSLVPEALLQKELRFVQMSVSAIVPEVLYMGLAVGLAYLGYGMWSLVYASLARAPVRALLQVSMCSEKQWLIPRSIDKSVFKSLLRYGVQSTGSGLVSFFNSIVDNLIVGRFLGVQALGYYSKAYDFSTHTVDGFNRVISGVLFPSYARMQDDSTRLLRAYLNTLTVLSLVAAPACLGLCVLAPEIIGSLFGEKWMPMVTAFQILCVMCLVRVLSSTTSPLFLAVGRPHFDLRAGLLVLSVMITMMFALMGWGIEGIASAMLIGQSIGYVYNLRQVQSLFPGAPRQILTTLFPALLSGLVMVAVVFFLRPTMVALFGNGILRLSMFLIAGALVFLGMMLLIRRTVLFEMIDLLRSAMRRTPPSELEGGTPKSVQPV